MSPLLGTSIKGVGSGPIGLLVEDNCVEFNGLFFTLIGLDHVNPRFLYHTDLDETRSTSKRTFKK